MLAGVGDRCDMEQSGVYVCRGHMPRRAGSVRAFSLHIGEFIRDLDTQPAGEQEEEEDS